MPKAPEVRSSFQNFIFRTQHLGASIKEIYKGRMDETRFIAKNLLDQAVTGNC